MLYILYNSVFQSYYALNEHSLVQLAFNLLLIWVVDSSSLWYGWLLNKQSIRPLSSKSSCISKINKSSVQTLV